MNMDLDHLLSLATGSPFDAEVPGADVGAFRLPSAGSLVQQHPSPQRPPSALSQGSGRTFNGTIGRMAPPPVWNMGPRSIAASSTASREELPTLTNTPRVRATAAAKTRTAAAAPASSPFLMDYAMPTAMNYTASSSAPIEPVGLTPEQQQQVYADFIAGRHLNSFNAQPPPNLLPTQSLQYQPPAHAAAVAPVSSRHENGAGGMSTDGSEDSDEDDEAPPTRKRGGRVKKESKEDQAAQYNHANHDLDGDPNDKERLGKRLARKAELARASRRRKKMYVQDLESKVKKLGQKIDELEAKASSHRSHAPSHVLVDEDQQRKSAQQTIRATMSALLSLPEPQDAIAAQRIQDLVRQFVENSRDRQAQVETYLDRVEQSLTPGLQAKFALWGLDQNDDFFTKPGLWTSLMNKEIGLTPQQLTAILAKRPAVHQERKNMAALEQMIKELRAKAGQHLRSLHQTMDEIQTVMTPTQLAKFYLWVENNEWTMHILQEQLKAPQYKTPTAR